VVGIHACNLAVPILVEESAALARELAAGAAAQPAAAPDARP